MFYLKKLLYSFVIAFSFLTSVPFPFLDKIKYDEENISFSLIFYPVVGLFFGLILFFSTKLLLYIKLNPSLITLAIITIPYLLNKFLHFDGLCDTIDAFLPNKTKEERLKILKYTNTGSFAIGVLILFILLKFELIKIFFTGIELLPLLIIIPVFSRYSMVFLSFISKYPRKNGTAFFIVGKVNINTFLLSTMFFLLINLVFLILFFSFNNLIIILFQIIFIFIFTFFFKIYSNLKIGGVTGDVLGALNEIIELLLFVIILILSIYFRKFI